MVDQAVDIIITNLRSAAEQYHAIHSRVPTLFIDGAGLIVKNEPYHFLCMFVACSCKLRIWKTYNNIASC